MEQTSIPNGVDEFASILRRLKLARYAQKKAANAEKRLRRGLSSKEREEILAKTGRRCHVCGGMIGESKWQADHVFSHAGGGTHRADNYLPSHALCNNYRWDFSPVEFQYILKLGVWLRGQIETETKIGRQAASAYIAKEVRRAKRCVTPRDAAPHGE